MRASKRLPLVQCRRSPSAAVAAANPLVKIPALITDDGHTLFDSPVICEYLDSLHAGEKLFPTPGARRWRALRMQAIGDGLMDAAILERYESVLRPAHLQWPEWVTGQRVKWHASLDALEREAVAELSPTAYSHIGTITVGCALGWLDFRFASVDWRSRRPYLANWFTAFNTRASMQATLPHA